ncbi:hypothetical protein ABZ916_36630 [Streptomyces sp. NPDC046853]|uniref:hypothetical protein n=1 Tax=Streptomyces sp. NPDC046853 TaxID=3154920 RepID=UPI0033E5D6D0
MSYELAVWYSEYPLDDDQAGTAYDELYARYLESDDVVISPVPRIDAYIEALTTRYPDDGAGGNVWASPPVIDEASGPVVCLLVTYGKAEEVSEYAATPAREHGLLCYDPQVERLRL